MPDELHKLLDYVKGLRAIDFGAYRPGTVRRRVERRLYSTGMRDYASYLNYIKENPAEVDDLIDSITIKVSRFFRDPVVFESLKEFVLPALIEGNKAEGLRVWCAGAARGEEAYSLAILIKELTEKDATEALSFIVATDIDKDALGEAGEGVYKTDAIEEVKKGRLDKYFTREGGRWRLGDEIKSMVTFAYHDLTDCTSPKEGIFSDYHLILCRNVLIYFEREVQERVLKSLSESLLKNGCLVLGDAETLTARLSGNFAQVMPRLKIFRKKA